MNINIKLKQTFFRVFSFKALFVALIRQVVNGNLPLKLLGGA